MSLAHRKWNSAGGLTNTPRASGDTAGGGLSSGKNDDLKTSDPFEQRGHLKFLSVESGGWLIGQLERALIFLLILIGQPAGIGSLVAAKSILRFEGAKRQQRAFSDPRICSPWIVHIFLWDGLLKPEKGFKDEYENGKVVYRDADSGQAVR